MFCASDGWKLLNCTRRKKIVWFFWRIAKINGFGVLELIRKSSLVPVIMLTALDDASYQIKGYDLRVDEYVTKPFSTHVLLRKIGAVLRRSGKHLSDEKNPEILQYGDLNLDSSGYQVWEEERKVELTQKEFELRVPFWKKGVIEPGISF